MVNGNKETANDNEIYKETNHLPVLSNVFKLELTANKELEFTVKALHSKEVRMQTYARNTINARQLKKNKFCKFKPRYQTNHINTGVRIQIQIQN